MTNYGKFYSFCKDTGSAHSTLPVCNLFKESPTRGGTGYNGCTLEGISVGGGERLANLGGILLAAIAIVVSLVLLWRSERKKAAVGRRYDIKIHVLCICFAY
jgi:hypothetical protein